MGHCQRLVFLLRICRSKNNHPHTCSLHHKQSVVNNSTCACVQCTSAAHARQCNTGTSKQTQDNRMAVCVVDAFALFCHDTDNCLLISPIYSSIIKIFFFQNKKSCLTKVTQKYRPTTMKQCENSNSNGPIKCIWEVRMPGRAASFQG